MDTVEMERQYVNASATSFHQLQLRDFVAVRADDGETWNLATILYVKRQHEQVQWIDLVFHEPLDGSHRLRVTADMVDQLKVSRRKYGRL